MKKITIDKEEGIAEVIDRILNEEDDDITIVVPKNSDLVRSLSNFRLLRREAEGAGKEVAVESVDDTVLAFAKECGLQAVHPLWRGTRGAGDEGGMSDIVPKSREAMRPKKKIESVEPVAVAEEEEEEEEEVEMDEADTDGEDEEEAREDSAMKRFFTSPPRGLAALGGRRNGHSESSRDDDDDDDNDGDNGPRKRIAGKVWGIIAVVVVLLLAGAWVASAYFDHANVNITFKKTPWTWQGNLTVDKSVASDNLAGGVLAGQVFTSNKNVTDTFKATGSAQTVSTKATGQITIYNDYSTKSQELVATTRFLTPDGKIFRITQNVTVPGATQGSGGALQPSTITAPIVADQPGPDYNVGPVSKLTIPGFAGKPEANGFWGVITASTTGGFTGTKTVPTAADITAAEASTTADLQASLQGGFNGSYPNNFKILDGATQVQVGKLTVNTTTDSSGNFTVYGTAALSAIGFDESALKAALLAQAQGTDPNSAFADANLNYGSVTANFTKGQVSFSLSVQSDLEPAFSAVDFEQQILGKNVNDARSTIAALPQLASAEISVWPVWLGTIPTNPSKIHINVN